MNNLTIGLLGALLATNQPQAATNLVQPQTGVSVAITNPNDTAEKELQKLMADDDAAQAEVDKWIRDNDAFAAQGAGESKDELNKRILARFDSVRKGYEDFLRRHPDNAPGHLAYGSFLDDTGDEDAAAAQNKTAAQLDPKNPAAWNNLANYYGEHGPLTNAFADYARAIELNPNEPVYYQNLATTVYLYPQGRGTILRHQRTAGFRQGARALPARPSSSTRIIFRSRPITRKATTASIRSAPTTRWSRGRTR